MKTFEDLCKVEPRLKALFLRIPDIMTEDRNFWKNWSKIKAAMWSMVGFDSAKPELGGPHNYDIAYQALLAEAERCADIIAKREAAK